MFYNINYYVKEKLKIMLDSSLFNLLCQQIIHDIDLYIIKCVEYTNSNTKAHKIKIIVDT